MTIALNDALASDPAADTATAPAPSTAPTRQDVHPARLLQAKHAYTTRFLSERLRADAEGYSLVSGDGVRPGSGDVVLARVGEIGQHTRLESPDSRRASLFVGDEVLVAYGNRYAPDQFEGRVPDDLRPVNLVAAGGLAAQEVGAHTRMLPATELEPIGLLADRDGVVNLARHAPYPVADPAGTTQPDAPVAPRPTCVAVLGTSMNSGKTTTAAALVRGLSAAGLRVGAAKLTGTGAGGDPGLFRDSGAAQVLDFTHFGHPSTYLLEHDEVRRLTDAMLAELTRGGAEVAVVEIADGLFQRETARLVADPAFSSWFDRCVFASGEALGAVAGRAHLAGLGIDVAAVSGLLTASPLAIGEARAALDVPVLDLEQLTDPEQAARLVAGAAAGAR